VESIVKSDQSHRLSTALQVRWTTSLNTIGLAVNYPFDRTIASHLAELAPISLDDIPATRSSANATLAANPPPIPAGLIVEDRSVPASFEGQPNVGVRIYSPSDARRDRPAVLHLHGGGYVMGSHLNTASRAMRIAAEVGAVVVSVGYRLAPESPFPAGLQDAIVGYRWLHAAAPEFGIDTTRIALHGVSAGAGLAAGLALYLRDNGIVPPCFQFLSIPMIDDRMGTGSATGFVDAPVWNSALNDLAWRAYLGPLFGSKDVPTHAAPARERNLAGLPPAYVSAMEFDPLRDEAVEYARGLQIAGVQVELHVFPGTFHGSIRFSDSAVSQREADEEVAVLRTALETSPAASA
jgi:acetyl esterase